MSTVEAPSLPKLPKLDKADVDAVRRFLPGKLLGRTAALLSLVLLVLGFGGAVDQGLRKFLSLTIQWSPWVYYPLIFGLPFLAVVVQGIVEWIAARNRHNLQALAVRIGETPAGYFRIGPYLDVPEDRDHFDRADGAHRKVLAWIKRSTDVPLYLTGELRVR